MLLFADAGKMNIPPTAIIVKHAIIRHPLLIPTMILPAQLKRSMNIKRSTTAENSALKKTLPVIFFSQPMDLSSLPEILLI
ncbi:MAG: hypothetical protein R2860_04375 [Desulfobacterales bacterium]